MVLTENMVRMHAEKSLFQDATTMIPLTSVDSLFYGWRRHKILLALGGLILLLGIDAMARHATGGAFISIFISAVFFAAFWFIRPGLILIRSTRESLGGTPVSELEALGFLEKVSMAAVKGKD